MFWLKTGGAVTELNTKSTNPDYPYICSGRLGWRSHQTAYQRTATRITQNYVLVESGGAVTTPGVGEVFTQSTQKHVLVKTGGAFTELNTKSTKPDYP